MACLASTRGNGQTCPTVSSRYFWPSPTGDSSTAVAVEPASARPRRGFVRFLKKLMDVSDQLVRTSASGVVTGTGCAPARRWVWMKKRAATPTPRKVNRNAVHPW